VQLEHVRPERCNDVEQGIVIGVDSKRDFAGPPLDALTKGARRFEAEVTRAWCEEHETNQIDPGIKHYIKRLRGSKAADFD
jgi:hypothetical protein